MTTPTSDKGFKGPSSPRGSVEEPLNPLVLMLEAGASFVARGYVGKLEHLADVMVQALEHKGFSFINVLQPCVSFNNTYKIYNELVEILEESAATLDEALTMSRRTDRLPIGVIYRSERPIYHKELYGDWNPITRRQPRDERLQKVKDLLAP